MFKVVILLLLGSLTLLNGTPLNGNNRFRRQTSSSASASAGKGPGSWMGAAAGVGGIGASTGLGGFQADPNRGAFLPFGAFAGLGQGDSRIAAGCSGLDCGFQLGNLKLSTGQIFNSFMNQSGSSTGPGGEEGGNGLRKMFRQSFGNFLKQLQQNDGPTSSTTKKPAAVSDAPKPVPKDDGDGAPSISDLARIGNNTGSNVVITKELNSGYPGKRIAISASDGTNSEPGASSGRPGIFSLFGNWEQLYQG